MKWIRLVCGGSRESVASLWRRPETAHGSGGLQFREVDRVWWTKILSVCRAEHLGKSRFRIAKSGDTWPNVFLKQRAVGE